MSKREELRKKRQEAVRRQQLIIIGVVAVAAIIVAGILIWPNLQPVGSVATPAAEDYSKADGSALGPADAKVVLELYSDFQCPYCRIFATSTEGQIIAQYINAGQSVRLDYRHFIVVDGNVGGSESRRSAEASECAADQGKFWQLHDYLFANVQGEGTGSLRDARITAMAQTVGLDMSAFNGCFNSGRYAQRVQSDELAGRQLGISGTPSLFINGAQVSNPLDMNEISSRINAGLGQ